MKNILLSLLLSLLAVACKSVKETQQSQEVTQRTRIDSIFVEKQVPLRDTVYINIPEIRTIKPECDSLCNEEVRKIMQQISVNRQQGEDSQGVYYNRYKGQLVVYQNIGARQSTYQGQFSGYSHTKAVEQTKIVKQYYVPKLVKILAFIGGGTLLFGVFWIGFRIKEKIRL